MTELCFNTMNHSAWLGIDAHLADQVPAAAAAGYRLFGPGGPHHQLGDEVLRTRRAQHLRGS
jgi:hypothetical protein